MPPRRGDGRDLCVDAVGRLERGPRGLAHHVRPPRRVPTSLAHVLSSRGWSDTLATCFIQCTGRWASESGECEHTDGEDTPFQGLYSESAPSARKGGSRLAALAAKARGGARQAPRFVRLSGRAARGSPQGLGPRCPASSARPWVSCASPERRGGSRSTSTGSIQCTGR